MTKNTVSGIFNDDEVRAFAIALGRGQETFTTEDLAKVIEWAEEIAVGQAMIDMILSGSMKVSVENGEVLFSQG